MHSIDYKEQFKMPETKLILWIVYDIFMVGFGGISLLNSFMVHVNDVEKVIIFLLFLTMGLYRIRILHHASKRKKLENESLEMDNEIKRHNINDAKENFNGTKKPKA